MLDIKYEIDDSFRCYKTYSKAIISIGGLGYNKLKDYEQDIFISDAITHEFIHILLGDIFDLTTSCLFEFIGDSLLNTKILRKVVNLTSDDSLWCDKIKEEGNRHIYDRYMIDNISLIQAYIITGGK